MKNKEKYDLRHISASINYQVNGCGKKIDPPRYINIYYKDNLVLSNYKTDDMLFGFVMNWLEEESEDN